MTFYEVSPLALKTKSIIQLIILYEQTNIVCRKNDITTFVSSLFFYSQIFFAVGIPIDIPDKSIAMAFYFEANYGLPYEWNSSYFYEENYYAKRSLSRQLVYRMLTNKMER